MREQQEEAVAWAAGVLAAIGLAAVVIILLAGLGYLRTDVEIVRPTNKYDKVIQEQLDKVRKEMGGDGY